MSFVWLWKSFFISFVVMITFTLWGFVSYLIFLPNTFVCNKSMIRILYCICSQEIYFQRLISNMMHSRNVISLAKPSYLTQNFFTFCFPYLITHGLSITKVRLALASNHTQMENVPVTVIDIWLGEYNPPPKAKILCKNNQQPPTKMQKSDRQNKTKQH